MKKENNIKFEQAFYPKCIYILRINDAAHKDLLKIGDATVKSVKPFSALQPNCRTLNEAARARIKDYTNTAGVEYELLHTELAVIETKDDDGNPILLSFKDHKVHNVLINSHIKRKEFSNSTAREWFKVDLATAKLAIQAVKSGKNNLSGEQITENFSKIIFRPEQNEAIEQTIKIFKKQDKMLWNAKMRFGKTLTALEVVRKSKFQRTIILTHRPVVDSGWYDDFNKIFYEENGAYIYGSKGTGTSLHDLLQSGKKFVYFASIQDLRGSKYVGGHHDKNKDVFDLDWDFVIVDEAHEGTTTALGDKVIKAIVKEDKIEHVTKFLALSGTPFNILGNFDQNIYTWDYVMEQEAKANWYASHLESNPYEDLPVMNIFTYDLGKLLYDNRYVEIEDKAFNFREFFRVWTGEKDKDGMTMPEGVHKGDFYHEEDVLSFLNLICKASEESQYPYSSDEYRNIFRHTLWMVPGVKEAKALSKLLKAHSLFSMFRIVNVAGDGDEEEERDKALKKVQKAIKEANQTGSYTITLSCGKLTTGVTVPEWTAAFYLAGSYSTSASTYLQTIFRVQSPCKQNGMIKTSCYVFDFAPDRTLKMISEAVSISTKAGGTSTDDRNIMSNFLNYCPVISIDGTRMKKYDTGSMLQQLKRAYAERAVRSGFDDAKIYSNELLKLSDDDLSILEDVKNIVGKTKASHQTKDIDVNLQGFTDEQYEEIEKIKKKPKKELTEEDKKRREEYKKRQEQRRNAITILRSISIRMPLLIYGADIPFEDDVTIEQLPALVDDASWAEFMPNGITKDKFMNLIKFYDPDIFVAAGRRIRNIARGADELPPIERAQKIAELFSYFKNPDKETVLTPWRVVNMHMGDCLGGLNFYDEEYKETVENLRFIDNGEVTKKTLNNPEAKILEINSKTGLYPLYITASIYNSKLNQLPEVDRTFEAEKRIWQETVSENVFVVCKTPMAKAITQRTLLGFSNQKINAHYFDDLVNVLKNKSNMFIDKVNSKKYWKKGKGMMNFNAVVGNPPYQESDGSGLGNGATPIYNHFVHNAKSLNTEFLSMIIPARWYGGGRGLDSFRTEMINDKRFRILHDYLNALDCFKGVELKGGVCYFLWDKNYSGNCEIYTHKDNRIKKQIPRQLKEKNSDVFIRYEEGVHIFRKVRSFNEATMDQLVSSQKPFGLRTYVHGDNQIFPNAVKLYERGGIGYISRDDIEKNIEWVDKPKVYISAAYNAGDKYPHQILGKPIMGEAGSLCTETYVVIGPFVSNEEAENVISYIKTKFFRFLVMLKKTSQHAAFSVYSFVPVQNFSHKWTDEMLYEKYNISDEEIAFIDSLIKPMK